MTRKSPDLVSALHWDLAFFIAEAAQDDASLNAGIEKFSQVAVDKGWKLEYWNHPTAPHGFDVHTHDERSQAIMLRTLDFFVEQLVPRK